MTAQFIAALFMLSFSIGTLAVVITLCAVLGALRGIERELRAISHRLYRGHL